MPHNADHTRQKILDAARAILAEDGFSGLGVNALAARAGVGKPLVYRYFGGLDGVARELMSDAELGPGAECADIGALVAFGRGLGGSRVSRDLLAWAVASPNGPDEGSSALTAGKSAGTSEDAALYALISAGAAFLLMWRDRHDSWAGVPLKSATDLARLEMAMARISDVTGR